MPDPVSNQPASRGSAVIECEPVPVGPNAESASDFECYEAEPEPGVKALVERQRAPVRTELREIASTHADIPYLEIARSCMTKALGVVVAIDNGGELGIFKAGLDLSACVAQEMDEARIKAALHDAVEDCENRGGVATGVIFDEVLCLGPGMFR